VGERESIVLIEGVIGEFNRHLKARTNLAPRTVQTYIDIAKTMFAKVNIFKIKADWIEDNIILDKTISQGTRRLRIFALRHFFIWCMWEGVRSDNPAKAVKPPRIPRAIHRNLRPEIICRIFSSLKNIRERVIIGLLYYCGLRADELLSLKVDDVNLVDHYVYVRHGKGGEERWVPCQNDNAFTDLLAQYVDMYDVKDWFIKTRNNAKMNYMTLREIIDEIGKRINYHFTAHQLRHSVASNLWKGGMDPMALMSFMGHKSIATTLRYVEVDFNTIQEKYNNVKILQKLA